MKITKEQLKRVIKEEISNVLKEVRAIKSGQLAGGIEWDILDNGEICFERYSEDEYSSSNVCVSLEELRQIIKEE